MRAFQTSTKEEMEKKYSVECVSSPRFIENRLHLRDMTIILLGPASYNSLLSSHLSQEENTNIRGMTRSQTTMYMIMYMSVSNSAKYSSKLHFFLAIIVTGGRAQNIGSGQVLHVS